MRGEYLSGDEYRLEPRRGISGNIALTFGVQLFSLLIGFVSNIIIARTLGAGGKGAFTLIITVFGLALMIGSLGIGQASVYLGAGRKYKITDITSTVALLAFILGIPLAISFACCLYALQPTFFRGVDKIYLILPVSFLSFNLLSLYLRYTFLAKENLGIYNLLVAVERLCYFVLLILLLIVLQRGLGGAVTSLILSFVITALVALVLAAKTTGIRFRFNRGFVKESVPYGIKASLSDVTRFMDLHFDIFLVGYFLVLEEVGFYSIAVAVSWAIFRLPAAVGVVLFTRVSSLSSTEANAVTSRLCRHTLFLVCLAALILLVFGNPIINFLFGAEFLPAVVPLWLLLPGTIAYSVSEILRRDLAGRGKPEIGLYAALLSFGVAIGLDFIFIPYWGIAGAAIASSIGYSLGLALALYFFLKIPDNTLKGTILITRSDFREYGRMLSKAILWLRALIF